MDFRVKSSSRDACGIRSAISQPNMRSSSRNPSESLTPTTQQHSTQRSRSQCELSRPRDTSYISTNGFLSTPTPSSPTSTSLTSSSLLAPPEFPSFPLLSMNSSPSSSSSSSRQTYQPFKFIRRYSDYRRQQKALRIPPDDPPCYVEATSGDSGYVDRWYILNARANGLGLDAMPVEGRWANFRLER
ncbi:MAG: hypothetical protein M1824_005610 [Vezdaea acicularis]|nr:MAG: hypothetical protein M1824_005610 [Vezdaea acicularis]